MKVDDIAESLANEMGLKKTVAKAYVLKVFDAMSDELIFGEGRIDIKNLFTIETVDAKSRKGRDIHTGEIIDIPAKKRLKIKASKNLINQLNNEYGG